MTATAAYLVINRNPDNGMDCIDEFDSFTEACEFAEEFGGEVVNASDYHSRIARRLVQRLALRSGSPLRRVTNFGGMPANGSLTSSAMMPPSATLYSNT